MLTGMIGVATTSVGVNARRTGPRHSPTVGWRKIKSPGTLSKIIILEKACMDTSYFLLIYSILTFKK